MKTKIGNLQHDEKLRGFLMILAANKLSIHVYDSRGAICFTQSCTVQGRPAGWQIKTDDGRIRGFTEAEVKGYDTDLTHMVLDFDGEE